MSLKAWPEYDEEKTKDDEIEIVVQVNGKIRDRIMVAANLSKEETENAALNAEKIKAEIEGKTIVKIIAVPGKLVNVVVR